jgi:hypothetical protein
LVSRLRDPALVILPTAFGLGAVALTIAATFDLWHVAMQQHWIQTHLRGKAPESAIRAGATPKRQVSLSE